MDEDAPKKAPRGLLDEMEELEQRRKKAKKGEGSKDDGLDLDGVWS